MADHANFVAVLSSEQGARRPGDCLVLRIKRVTTGEFCTRHRWRDLDALELFLADGLGCEKSKRRRSGAD